MAVLKPLSMKNRLVIEIDNVICIYYDNGHDIYIFKSVSGGCVINVCAKYGIFEYSAYVTKKRLAFIYNLTPSQLTIKI